MTQDISTESTELTVCERAALALESSKTEQHLKELAGKNTSIVVVIDKAGRAQAHGAAMELRTARTDIEKASKAARDDATQFQKACIAEEKRLIAIIQPEEARLLSLRDSWDAEQERIKKEAEAAERARVLAITQRIAEIGGYVPLAAQCRTADRVMSLLNRLRDMGNEGLDFFEEFTEEAVAAFAQAEQALVKLHSEKADQEAAQARLKAEVEAEVARMAVERAELARARAELEAMREQMTPKSEPVGEFEKAVQEFAKAVEPAPSFVKPAMKVVADPAPARKDRPTDMQIVEALALHFRVHESKALAWLYDMDLDAISASIEAEFI